MNKLHTRLQQLEKQPNQGARVFDPHWGERIGAQYQALYAKLRAMVEGDLLPEILQNPENEVGRMFIKRFDSNDPAIVKARAIELLNRIQHDPTQPITAA